MGVGHLSGKHGGGSGMIIPSAKAFIGKAIVSMNKMAKRKNTRFFFMAASRYLLNEI